MKAYLDPRKSEVAPEGLEWEKKQITQLELLEMNLLEKDIVKMYEELITWMLSGEHCEWKIQEDKTTGDLILWRR